MRNLWVKGKMFLRGSKIILIGREWAIKFLPGRSTFDVVRQEGGGGGNGFVNLRRKDRGIVVSSCESKTLEVFLLEEILPLVRALTTFFFNGKNRPF
jgi:hypothetical protein